LKKEGEKVKREQVRHKKKKTKNKPTRPISPQNIKSESGLLYGTSLSPPLRLTTKSPGKEKNKPLMGVWGSGGMRKRKRGEVKEDEKLPALYVHRLTKKIKKKTRPSQA